MAHHVSLACLCKSCKSTWFTVNCSHISSYGYLCTTYRVLLNHWQLVIQIWASHVMWHALVTWQTCICDYRDCTIDSLHLVCAILSSRVPILTMVAVVYQENQRYELITIFKISFVMLMLHWLRCKTFNFASHQYYSIFKMGIHDLWVVSLNPVFADLSNNSPCRLYLLHQRWEA